MEKTLNFKCLKFDQLSVHQLYRILQLRQEVFVIEQDCIYVDVDNIDQKSYHVIGTDNNNVIQAYTRLISPDDYFDKYSCIGRVLTSKSIREKKQGYALMQFSIKKNMELWQDFPIKISAQLYLHRFYRTLGFKKNGEEYLEDNIPHIEMIRE